MALAQLNIDTPSTVFTTGQGLFVPGTLLWRILLYAIPAAGIYFFLRLIISGYAYMTSLGSPEKIQAAHQQIVHAFFGLIIVLSAFFLASATQYIFHLNFL